MNSDTDDDDNGHSMHVCVWLGVYVHVRAMLRQNLYRIRSNVYVEYGACVFANKEVCVINIRQGRGRDDPGWLYVRWRHYGTGIVLCIVVVGLDWMYVCLCVRVCVDDDDNNDDDDVYASEWIKFAKQLSFTAFHPWPPKKFCIMIVSSADRQCIFPPGLSLDVWYISLFTSAFFCNALALCLQHKNLLWEMKTIDEFMWWPINS